MMICRQFGEIKEQQYWEMTYPNKASLLIESCNLIVDAESGNVAYSRETHGK